MPDRSHFNAAQNQLLGILTDGFSSGKERLLVAMPSGMGRTAVVTAFLQNILAKLSIRDEVALIVKNKALGEQVKLRLTEELNFPVSDVSDVGRSLNVGINIILLAELNKIDSLRLASDESGVRLAVMLDADERSLKQVNWNNGILEARQQIAFTNYPYLGKDFGKYDFVYSTLQAVSDELLVEVKVIRVDMSLSEGQKEKWEEFDKLPELEDLPSSTIYGNHTYLQAVCADIQSRITSGKTVVFASNIQQAALLVNILNQLYGGQVCRVVHSNLPSDEVWNTVRKFRNLDSGLNMLVLVDLSTSMLEVNVENIILLKRFGSLERIAEIFGLAQRKFAGRESSIIYDYRENTKLEQLFSSFEITPTLDEVKVPRKYLSESQIRFRDKSDIDPVLGASEIAGELADIIQIIPGEQGAMIGVFGMWGRGKTFLMELLWKELAKNNEFIRVDFHAWKYQDTPATWAYLYERFAERYFEGGKKRNWLSKKWFQFWRTVKLNWKRQGSLPFLKI